LIRTFNIRDIYMLLILLLRLIMREIYKSVRSWNADANSSL